MTAVVQTIGQNFISLWQLLELLLSILLVLRVFVRMPPQGQLSVPAPGKMEDDLIRLQQKHIKEFVCSPLFIFVWFRISNKQNLKLFLYKKWYLGTEQGWQIDFDHTKKKSGYYSSCHVSVCAHNYSTVFSLSSLLPLNLEPLKHPNVEVWYYSIAIKDDTLWANVPFSGIKVSNAALCAASTALQRSRSNRVHLWLWILFG